MTEEGVYPRTGDAVPPFSTVPSSSQLRAFASVAEAGGISRGAADLGRSQPAVTQAIASLESSFGVPLFIRQRSGLILTDAGTIIHKRVQRYFDEVRAAVTACGADRGWGGPQVDAKVSRLTRPLTVALLLVDELGSIARAAKLLGQRETTLRKAITSIESALEINLFNHEPSGISTNVSGRLLAARLRLAMREMEAAREEVAAGFGVENGRILAGAMMLAGNQLITSVLERFTKLHPQASISVVNASYDVLIDRLKRGAIDFVVGLQYRPSPAENLVEEVIAADPFVLAVRRGHPLAGHHPLTQAELARYNWVLSAPGTVRRDAFEQLFTDVASPVARVETHSIVTILSLLANSDVIAIMTQSELLLDKQLGNRLEALRFGPLMVESHIAMTTRRGWLPTRLQTAFAQAVMESSSEDASLQVELDQAERRP